MKLVSSSKAFRWAKNFSDIAWERQSPDGRLASRTSADWRSRVASVRFVPRCIDTCRTIFTNPHRASYFLPAIYQGRIQSSCGALSFAAGSIFRASFCLLRWPRVLSSRTPRNLREHKRPCHALSCSRRKRSLVCRLHWPCLILPADCCPTLRWKYPAVRKSLRIPRAAHYSRFRASREY